MNRSSSCNCRRKDQCSLAGNCQAKSIVCKATVNNGEGTKQYIGLTENTFKQCYSSHLQSMRHKKYESSTELSKYIWRMKRSSKDTNKWSIHKRAPAYSNATKRCKLCLAEKLAIVTADRTITLSKRSEMVSWYVPMKIKFTSLHKTDQVFYHDSCHFSHLLFLIPVSVRV